MTTTGRYRTRGLALFAALLTSLACCAIAAQAASTTVHIENFSYAPARLTVHAGDRVVFRNDDDEAHTVTSSDKSFDSGGLDTGGKWSHTFERAGTYHYFCALHPFMKGTIVVTPAQAKNDGT